MNQAAVNYEAPYFRPSKALRPFIYEDLHSTTMHCVCRAAWIIAHQLGRRNCTAEQKSYLRGKRYNQEKRQDGGHGDQRSGTENPNPKANERLAEEYQVHPDTIVEDGKFAEAL